MSQSKKVLRNSARGRDCQVRIPGVCNHDPETVVLAHVGGGGMGLKQPDLFGAFCCQSCHSEVDRRTRRIPAMEARFAHLEGVMRTQEIWIKEGLVKW